MKPYVVVSNLNDVLRGVVVLLVIDPFSTRILCHRITNLNDLYTSPFSQIDSFAFDSSEVCRHEFSLCLGQGPATLLARDYFQLVKMVGKFIGHCLNFPSIYTGDNSIRINYFSGGKIIVLYKILN